jgi:hypothetical protein
MKAVAASVFIVVAFGFASSSYMFVSGPLEICNTGIVIEDTIPDWNKAGSCCGDHATFPTTLQYGKPSTYSAVPKPQDICVLDLYPLVSVYRPG